MWICLNDAFFTIVASDRDPALLVVRARREGDLERYFPGHKVDRLPNRDYAFRVYVLRADVGKVLADNVEAIPYTNFKNSVRDHRLHDAYLDVWGIMHRLQEQLLRAQGAK